MLRTPGPPSRIPRRLSLCTGQMYDRTIERQSLSASGCNALTRHYSRMLASYESHIKRSLVILAHPVATLQREVLRMTNLVSLGRSILAEVLGRIDGPVRKLLSGRACVLGELVRSALHLVTQLTGSRLCVLGQLLHGSHMPFRPDAERQHVMGWLSRWICVLCHSSWSPALLQEAVHAQPASMPLNKSQQKGMGHPSINSWRYIRMPSTSGWHLDTPEGQLSRYGKGICCV